MNVRTTIVLLLAFAGIILAQDRMPPIAPEKMTEAQKDAARQLASTPRTAGLNGPFVPLLRSPEFMNRLQRVGEYLRFQSPLEARIREMAILMAARHWSQQYEWNAHYPLALSSGLKKDAADAIAAGRRPDGMAQDEEAVWGFVTELLQNGGVSDPTYARVVQKFGEQGVVDITGLVGYYSTLAMVMNVARTPAQPAADTPKLMLFAK
jgi:4-carboxymuconolactone decarboxylase